MLKKVFVSKVCPTEIYLPISIVGKIEPSDSWFTSFNVSSVEVSEHNVRVNTQVFVFRDKNTNCRTFNLLLMS